MEFKGTEVFETEKGIYEYTGVIHDDEKVYGILANTNNDEECFMFSEVLCVWQKVSTGESNCPYCKSDNTKVVTYCNNCTGHH